ncbi:MAG: AAA family ATPase [Variovorax sp.]|nr:AAA family ATPase [Variovorax sp.]
MLGALLLDNAAFSQVESLLDAGSFYRREHRLIYAAISAQILASRPADVITVHEHLASRAEAEQAGGLAYLNELAQYVPSAGNIRRYAEIVRERCIRRKLVGAADEIASAAFDPQGRSVEALIDAAQMAVARLATARGKRREPQHIRDSLPAYIAHLQDLAEGKNPAIPTGLGGLDALLNGGLRRGELFVLGARPKVGKTALGLAIARHVARSLPVLYLSQEMAVYELMNRHAAALGGCDLGAIRRADPHDPKMWDALSRAAEIMASLDLLHDDQTALRLFDIKRKAIETKRQRGDLALLVVDFLQLMDGGGGEDNRNRELDVIANGLKALAGDLDLACILLSQLNRKADEHFAPPTMTHLRDSGAIEAAADAVALMFTPNMHPLSRKEPEFAGYSEVHLVAHRSGATGLVPLSFHAPFQQLSDWRGPRPERASRARIE